MGPSGGNVPFCYLEISFLLSSPVGFHSPCVMISCGKTEVLSFTLA
jgi:hypothetical protein